MHWTQFLRRQTLRFQRPVRVLAHTRPAPTSTAARLGLWTPRAVPRDIHILSVEVAESASPGPDAPVEEEASWTTQAAASVGVRVAVRIQNTSPSRLHVVNLRNLFHAGRLDPASVVQRTLALEPLSPPIDVRSRASVEATMVREGGAVLCGDEGDAECVALMPASGTVAFEATLQVWDG